LQYQKFSDGCTAGSLLKRGRKGDGIDQKREKKVGEGGEKEGRREFFALGRKRKLGTYENSFKNATNKKSYEKFSVRNLRTKSSSIIASSNVSH
jgi:predicted secreted protein